MSAARHLWRRVLVRLRPADRRASSPADVEGALLALTDEFEANDRALRDLLACDGRDTADVPGFDALADRQADAARADRRHAGAGPRRPGRQGALCPPASARAGLRRRPELWRSPPADDLLRLVGAAPSLTRPGLPSLDPSRAAAAEMPPKKKEPDMATRPDAARRLAILRRNNSWRQLSTTLSQLGAWSLGAAAVLPFYRLPLPWFVIAALGAVGVGTIYLAFFVLRFIDHSE